MTAAANEPISEKKIALAVENFSRHAGGAESYAVDLAASLLEAGWRVHLFGHAWDGQPEGARFHKIETPPAWLPAWAKLLRFAREHRRLVRAAGFDLDSGVVLGFGNTVFMNAYQSHGGVHAVSTAKKLFAEPRPLVRTAKRLLLKLSLKNRVREAIESAPFRLEPRPRILAIADMIKADMLAAYGLDAGAVEVIYNGIDTARYNPTSAAALRSRARKRFGLAEDAVVFSFMSYDLKKKGLAVLIEAAGMLKRRGAGPFTVLVVGGRPKRAMLRLVERLRLEEAIVFAGPTKAPEEVYAASDAFVLPTYYDACSLVVIEAMASGLPVVTTEANGAAGLIDDGVEGFVIAHPPQAGELARRLAELMDAGRRRAMGEKAAESGARRSLADTHRRLAAVFEEMIAGQKTESAGNESAPA